METRISSPKSDRTIVRFKYLDWFRDKAQGYSGGIWLLWQKDEVHVTYLSPLTLRYIGEMWRFGRLVIFSSLHKPKFSISTSSCGFSPRGSICAQSLMAHSRGFQSRTGHLGEKWLMGGSVCSFVNV